MMQRLRFLTSVTYMIPVSVCSIRQFFPSFYKQDTSITDFTATPLLYPETFLKLVLILAAVCKSRARRLCPTNTTSIITSIYLRFMETKHFWNIPEKNIFKLLPSLSSYVFIIQHIFHTFNS